MAPTDEEPPRFTFWERVALARFWLLARTRPSFHYAVEVLFQTVVVGCTIWLTVQVLNLFGMNLAVDFDLIGHFVGPLGVGALAAGLMRELLPRESGWKGWLVAGTYGGVSVLIFAILVELAWRAPTLPGAVIGFSAGAGFFMLLHWLYELESKKHRAA